MVIAVSDSSELERLLGQHPQLVLKFSAEWCGPCKAVRPAFEAMQATYPQIAFADVDIDRAPDVAQAYSVTAVPSFVFFNNAIVVDTVVGGDLSKLNACLRALAAKSPTFGRGKRVGSAAEGEPSISELRRMRAARYSGSAQDPASEPKNTAENRAGKPKTRPPTAGAMPDMLTTLLFYLKLYFFTLFSFDARSEAMRLRRSA